MAYRLIAHHRAAFSPLYQSGTASKITRSARRLLSYDVGTEQDFDEKVLKSEKPVVVDFFASWCGPCKVLTPTLEEVMNLYDGKADLVKVDVDDLQDLAMDYGVMSVPTVIGMKNGKVVDQFIGARNKDGVQEFVQKLIDAEQ